MRACERASAPKKPRNRFANPTCQYFIRRQLTDVQDLHIFFHCFAGGWLGKFPMIHVYRYIRKHTRTHSHTGLGSSASRFPRQYYLAPGQKNQQGPFSHCATCMRPPIKLVIPLSNLAHCTSRQFTCFSQLWPCVVVCRHQGLATAVETELAQAKITIASLRDTQMRQETILRQYAEEVNPFLSSGARGCL